MVINGQLWAKRISRSSVCRFSAACVVWGLLAWLVFAERGHAQQHAADLPDESVLPWTLGRQPVVGTAPPALAPARETPTADDERSGSTAGAELRLPDESVLPHAWEGWASRASSDHKVPQGGGEETSAHSDAGGMALPGEHVLAMPITGAPPSHDMPRDDNTSQVLTQTDGVQRQPAGDGDSDVSPGETRPWLRLQYEGHTERVRSLDVSADGLWAVSGGEDKVLHVWQRNPERGWLHRRSIRWQVERGPRGRIYRVALRGKFAALAGHGAMGGLGEIWIVDITTGELQRALVDNQQGHLQTIARLAWAPGEDPLLASADVQGRVMLWRPDSQTGLWAGRILVDRDEATYGSDLARRLAPLRTFVSLAFAGPRHVVVPRFVGVSQTPPREAIWRLQRLAIDGEDQVTLGQSEHRQTVVAMSGSSDGRRIASADATGRVRVWTFSSAVGNRAADRSNPPVTQIPRSKDDGQPLDLRLDPSGNRLLIGYASPAGGGAELWQLPRDGADPRRTGRVTAPVSVTACALGSAGGGEIWLASGSTIQIYPFNAAGSIAVAPAQQLATSVRPVQRVAFAESKDGYELAIGYGDDWEDTFDVSQIQLGREAEIDAARFRAAQPDGPQWTTRPEATPSGGRYRLYFGDQPRALLPLEPETHGIPTAIAVLQRTAAAAQDQAVDGSPRSGAAGDLADAVAPQAIVVGTSSRGNLYVYEAPSERTEQSPRLLRQFRGHTGSVTSLNVSADGKYLASGSEDATLGLWPLRGLWDAQPLENRWGLELAVTELGLEVTRLREDGPLFFRGVREGDTLVGIRWSDPAAQDAVQRVTEPDAMRRALADVAFDTLVAFQWERRGEPLATFQSFPAWQPLAQLFIDRDREWAIWTPAGIYDASVNGHRRFGWQVNRGIDRLPEFFRADQFRQRLERPDVLRRLLDRGSLAGALVSVGGAGPPVGEAAIVNQLRARPRIQWLSPAADAQVVGERVEIEAEIRLPLGATLSLPKVYAAGVAATTHQRLGGKQQDGEQIEHYRWSVPLVDSANITLEIMAATQAGAWDRVTRTVRRRLDAELPARKPRLHLIAVGVGAYRDPQIQSLDFAAHGATAVYELFASKSEPLYRFDGVRLLDHDAVRPLWHAYSRMAVERLASEVHADDLVVLYLCGHGLRDRRTGQWYFVTADARHADLMNDRYSDCLGLDDLSALSSLGCRKVAILDSCHSGAVQPAMQAGDLKAALRWLQEDRILTLTASEGHEEAAEDRELRLGRFTARLAEALDGAADHDHDGVVSLDEAFAYVREALAADAHRDGFVQRPTAGPIDLWRSIHIPLTATSEYTPARRGLASEARVPSAFTLSQTETVGSVALPARPSRASQGKDE